MTLYKYNSADNHLDQRWIPARLWQDRVAARFREAAPKVVEHEGAHLWSWEGKIVGGRDGGSADGPDNRALLDQFFGRSGARIPGTAVCRRPTPDLLLEHMGSRQRLRLCRIRLDPQVGH